MRKNAGWLIFVCMMTRVFFLIITVFFFAPVFAQNSSATFFSDDGNAFILFIDGVQQNKGAQTRVKVNNLAGPYHSVKIVFAQSSIQPLEKKNVSVVDSDQRPASVAYKIKKDKNGKARMSFYSMLPPEPPGSNTTEIPPAPEESTAQPAATVTPQETPTENKAILSNVSGAKISLPEKKQEGEKAKVVAAVKNDEKPSPAKTNIKTDKPATPVATTPTPAKAPIKKYEAGPDKKCNDWPMMKEEFLKVKAPVADAKDDKRRLQAARKLINENCLLVSQVSEIAQLFEDHENRFAFLVYAHGAVIDKPNFGRLKALFKQPDYQNQFEQQFTNK